MMYLVWVDLLRRVLYAVPDFPLTRMTSTGQALLCIIVCVGARHHSS